MRATKRVVVGGALAMAITYLVGLAMGGSSESGGVLGDPVVEHHAGVGPVRSGGFGAIDRPAFCGAPNRGRQRLARKTGDENRAAMAVRFAALPSANSANRARPANP